MQDEARRLKPGIDGEALPFRDGRMFDGDQSKLSGNNGTEMHARVQAAAETFAKYDHKIRAMIGFQVKDKSKADDIFQEFFVSLVHKPIPPDVEDVEAYLYRAVTNDVIDVWRRATNYRDGIQEYADSHRNDTMQEDPQGNFFQAEAEMEMLRLIERRLTKRQAAVVRQRYGNGLSMTDTAKKMNLAEKTVARYLSLARKRIRKLTPQDLGDYK